MIKQAIVAHASEARQGIGRATIKKYIQSHFPETAKAPEASFNTRVNQAITRGAAKKTFVLPKGPSGKVKLAPKEKASEKKAAAKPAAAKKPAAKPAAKKATTTAKKVSLMLDHVIFFPLALRLTVRALMMLQPAAKKTAVKKTTSSAATKAKKPAAKAKKVSSVRRFRPLPSPSHSHITLLICRMGTRH